MTDTMYEDVAKANEDFHDRFADYYDEYYHNVIFFDKNQRRIRRNLEHLRAKTVGNVLLDLGCGTGNIGRLAKDLWQTRYGVDISGKSLKKAQAHYTELFKGDVCDLRWFENNSVDLVTGYSLLHHLADPCPLLREVARVVKPSGYVYFDNDPNSTYFIFSLASYLSATIIDWIERVHRKARTTGANAVIDEAPEVYKKAEYHHYGGWYEGFFPGKIRRLLNEVGFRNVEIQLFQINRRAQDVKYTSYSFFAQFRYSQMCVVAERA